MVLKGCLAQCLKKLLQSVDALDARSGFKPAVEVDAYHLGMVQG